MTRWEADSSHFPVLESVFFEGLSKLDEFPSGIGDIPTLGKIFLAKCSASSIISAMRMMVEQEEQGNEELQLYVAFKGHEEALAEAIKQKVEEEGLTTKNIHLQIQM